MVFASLIFLCCFFPIFFIVYYLGKSRTARNVVLLIFSLIFYAWGEVTYLWLLLLSIFTNWVFALSIDRAKNNQRPVSAKTVLAISVAFNLLVIGVYKYAGFIVGIINQISGLGLESPNLPLPVGISFFTFQIMSYVIDVYRGDVKVQKNLGIVALYLAAFPQLIAGPVVRYSTIEHELLTRSETISDIKSGLSRFIVGLSKKVLIANTVAAAADGIFAAKPEQYGMIGAWMAVVAYTLQIYYDFSGYSDMAIGMGKMMGFNYDENFTHPYSAVTLTDFWRKWHISLSSFFRDYVYIPLGGNRVSRIRWIFNMLVVWGLTGLWHGAGVNFVLWGLYYGVLLILEKIFWGEAIRKIPVVRRIYTLLAVMIGWVIFRIETVGEIIKVLASMIGRYGLSGESLVTILIRSDTGIAFVLAACAGILLAGGNISGALMEKAKKYKGVSEAVSVGLLILCILGLETGSYNPFIYFRF